MLPWSWKDRICSQTSKSDWRFGSGGENRCNILPWIDGFFFHFWVWKPGRISKTSSCQTWEGAVGLVASRSFLRSEKRIGVLRWPNDAWIVCCSDPSRQSVKVKATSQRVTSPRVGCNCHRIRSRTEISKAFSEAHIEVGTLGFDFVKGAETKKYSKMCQVCRCGWQGTSLPAVCPCQGSHLRHFQEREGETLLIHYGLNCRWPHLVVSVSDQKHSECVTNFCRILRNWLKSLRNSKMIMGEIVCNLV